MQNTWTIKESMWNKGIYYIQNETGTGIKPFAQYTNLKRAKKRIRKLKRPNPGEQLKLF